MPDPSKLARSRRHDERRRITQPWRALYRTPRWRATRQRVLAAQPICAICRKARSTVCDHKHRHGGDPVKFFAGPFQGLCQPCHDRIKQRWESQNGAAPPIGLDGWPVT